jgi:gamma-glutamylcyclotransferase (GGCT)/AIG2-like uncharacterized protein YtfP
MTPFLFVYGTLLPGAAGKMGSKQRSLLQNEGEFLGPAFASGVLLDLGAYPGMMDGSEIVHGGIYRLHDGGKTLKWLDAYEGITGGEGDEYVRREAQSTLADGKILTAWTYVFIGNSQGLCKIPSGRWQ